MAAIIGGRGQPLTPDVHIISNYEGEYNHGFGPVTSAGSTNVQLRVSGEGSKPLVLVFVSYEPVNWILSIPEGVTIEKILLVIFFVVRVQVEVYTCVYHRDHTT